jgi:hypothetical protein
MLLLFLRTNKRFDDLPTITPTRLSLQWDSGVTTVTRYEPNAPRTDDFTTPFLHRGCYFVLLASIEDDSQRLVWTVDVCTYGCKKRDSWEQILGYAELPNDQTQTFQSRQNASTVRPSVAIGLY